jgi:GWxTD domain-containing protein
MAHVTVRPRNVLLFVMLCSSGLTFAEARQSQIGAEYSRWLNEDVHWIVTDQERTNFLMLETGKARDEFIREFWERRNPTPGARHNSFKEEHYRRLAFANEHFAARAPGWTTDRGHIYILYGPPDAITPHVASGTTVPSQTWHYRRLGDNTGVSFEFVDACRCGEYKLKR